MKAHRGRRCPVAVAMCVLAVSAAAAQEAGPTTRPARPDRHTVYIPYKDLERVFERSGRGVYLPYEEFMRLWEKARRPAALAEPPVAAVINSASYTGTIRNGLAAIDASYQVEVLTPGWTRLPIGLTGVAVGKATLGGEPARLVARPGGGFDLLVSRKGTHQLDLSFAVPIQSEPGLKSFSFGSPPAPVSQLQFDIPEKDVRVEVKPLLAATLTPVDEGATRVLAFLGSTGSVRVEWKPRPVDVTKLKPLVFATTDTHTTLAEGVMRTQATLSVNVLRAPVATFKIALPLGLRLVSIKGENLKDWTLAGEAKRQVLTADLHAGVTGAYTLTLQLERLLPDDAAQVVVPEVSLMGAQRETGHVAVDTAAPLRSEVLEQTNLSQVDIKELPAGLRGGERVIGYRFLKHPYTLRLGLTRVRPRVEVAALNQVTIERDRLRLDARLIYTIRKAGLFRLRVQVPAGLEVLEVGRPGSVSDSRVRPGADGGPTTIEIDLPRRTMGTFQLPIRCEGRRAALAGTVALPTVEPLDVQKEVGYVAVLAPEALKVVAAEQVGLIPVGTSELVREGAPEQDAGGNRLTFGYRYRRRPISATVDVTARKTKVTAEVLSRYNVARDVVRARVALRYTIQYAGVDTLKFQVPTAISGSAKVTGPDIKEHRLLAPAEGDDTDWVTWQVVLQAEATGVRTITVAYDLDVPPPADGAPVPVTIPVIRVREADPRVERETGQIALLKAADLAVEPTPAGLETIDPRELDATLRQDAIAMAFKYYTSDYQLVLAVSRHEFAEIATTVATKATLETIALKDGVVNARARWRVKTVQRQFLEVSMPAGARIAGLTVDRRPVQPQKGTAAEVYLVPLGGSVGGEKEALVEVVYSTPPPAGGSVRRLTLDAPALPDDVPVQKLYWVIYLSEDRFVRRLTSTLSDETAWEVGWQAFWPRVRPTSSVDPGGWIGAGDSSAATFKPSAGAQAFLLSGMGGRQSATVVTGDRRLVGAVVFVALLVIGLIFAWARIAIKVAVLVLLIAGALFGAVVNQTMVLEGLSAGAYGVTALIAIWLLEYVFIRIPRSVRLRRAAVPRATPAAAPTAPEPTGEAPPEDEGGPPEPPEPPHPPQPPEPPADDTGGAAAPVANSAKTSVAPEAQPPNATPTPPPAKAPAEPTKPETPAQKADDGTWLSNDDIDRLVDEVLIAPSEEEEEKEERKEKGREEGEGNEGTEGSQ